MENQELKELTECDIYWPKLKIKNRTKRIDIIVVTSSFLNNKLHMKKGFYPRIVREGIELYIKKAG